MSKTKDREAPFSKARQNLTAILDEVERSGNAFTIVRRGRPSVVIVDYETYRRFITKPIDEKWTLKGSITVKAGVDIDKELLKSKQKRIRMLRLRREKPTTNS